MESMPLPPSGTFLVVEECPLQKERERLPQSGNYAR